MNKLQHNNCKIGLQKRKEDAELKKTLDELRAAVVCVLGHVDTGMLLI